MSEEWTESVLKIFHKQRMIASRGGHNVLILAC